MSKRVIETKQNESIELYARSDTQLIRVGKFAPNGGFIIGTAGIDGEPGTEFNNVKLHRGIDSLQILSGDDTTDEGLFSQNTVSLHSKDIEFGQGTSGNNVKLRRAGTAELEVVLGSDTVWDGTPSPSNRINFSAGSVMLGKDAATSNNIRIRRGGNGEAELVLGSDSTADGSPSPSTRTNLNAKSIVLGTDAITTNNIKIRRGNGGLQIVPADDTTSDGVTSPNFVNILGITNVIFSQYKYVVGSAADVTQHAATHSSLVEVVASSSVGDQILVLSSYNTTENVTINKSLSILGCGNGSKIDGDLTVSANNCLIKAIRVDGDLSVSGNYNMVKEIWMPSGRNLSDAGIDNLYEVIREN